MELGEPWDSHVSIASISLDTRGISRPQGSMLHVLMLDMSARLQEQKEAQRNSPEKAEGAAQKKQ